MRNKGDALILCIIAACLTPIVGTMWVLFIELVIDVFFTS